MASKSGHKHRHIPEHRKRWVIRAMAAARKRRAPGSAPGHSVAENDCPRHSSPSTPPLLSVAGSVSAAPNPAVRSSLQSRGNEFHWLVATIATVVVHLLAASVIIRGLVLRASFHNGMDCDMTYSRFKFLPLHVKDHLPGARPYRLLKFVDMRDQRHLHLWGSGSGSGHDDGTRIHRLADNWCLLPGSDYTLARSMATAPYPNPGHPVLFVPGHWGEHKQARSLGAHGTQWTRAADPRGYEISRRLMDGTINARGDEGIGHFVYDVFTVDFDGDGAALHGSRLVRQAHFVARSIMTIAEACQASSITIVAHSVGGIVARAVPVLYPETRPYLKDIITLATPQVSLPYAFDSSVVDFYNLLNATPDEGAKDEGKLEHLVVSISGGLRDELIPSQVCEIEGGLALLASNVMLPSTDNRESVQLSLGMDHKAISWCHNVLSVVRNIIYTAATISARSDAISLEDRIRLISDAIGHDPETGFAGVAKEEYASLSKAYGILNSTALQVAMPYRLREFVGLYFLTAVTYLVLSALEIFVLAPSNYDLLAACASFVPFPSLVAFTFTACFGTGMEWETLPSVTLLSYAASTLYLAILYGLFPVALPIFRKIGPKSRHAPWRVCSICAAAAFLALAGFRASEGGGVVLNQSTGAAFLLWAMALSVMALAAALPAAGSLHGTVAALVLPIFPFAVAGKMIYALTLSGIGGQRDEALFIEFEERSVDGGRGGWPSFIRNVHLMRCVVCCLPLIASLISLWHWGAEQERRRDDRLASTCTQTTKLE